MSTHPPKASIEGLRIDRSRAPKASSRGWLIGLAVLLIVLAGGGAAAWFLAQPKAIIVHTALARAATAQSDHTLLNASGYVTARRQSTISSKDTGKVIDVLVEEGMKVTEGQVLAHLDATNVQAGLDQALAQLESAKKALIETSPNLDLAKRDQERIAQLAANDYASKSDLDHSQVGVTALQAHVDTLQSAVTIAEKNVAVWQQQLEDTIIRAPFAGVVISKDAQPGEMISPISAGGGFTRTGICTIVDMASLEIEVDVNESYINRVQPAQPAEATLDAYPDWKIPAKVIAIIPTADRQKATVKVRVGFVQLDPRILPDMSVKVAFMDSEPAAKSTAATGVMIPKTAVNKDGDKSIVWILRDGKAERRAVTTGAVQGDDILIAAGVNDGEKIILDGSAPLADGAAVSEAKP
jgi:RND family efflux transporter MFP subunit